LTQLPGDENLSCTGLSIEMQKAQVEMDRLGPKRDKFGHNAICFIGGLIIIVPFFFMDFKNAEKIEYDAYQRRFDRLMTLATEKNCDLESGPVIELETIVGPDGQITTRHKVNAEKGTFKGYKGTIDQATGKPVTRPVYEKD
jgi:hypothetical protein